MNPTLWVTAIVATIGVRGFASLMIVGSLVMGVLYLMVRRNGASVRVQAATEKLRGVRG